MKKLIALGALSLSLLIAASPTFAYTVKSGDTMTDIANRNGLTLQELSKANPQIKDLDLIYVGQHINLATKSVVANDNVHKESSNSYQSFIATAYSMGTITATGTIAQEGRTIAVDPNVIPLGSKVELQFPPKYSYLNGIYTAEDTGRLIKGNKIDIYLGSDQKCIDFGVQNVKVKILN
jgi:3D (Asp-Asp-Asp) domain-containing protein